jgi:hypothetical protein
VTVCVYVRVFARATHTLSRLRYQVFILKLVFRYVGFSFAFPIFNKPSLFQYEVEEKLQL